MDTYTASNGVIFEGTSYGGAYISSNHSSTHLASFEVDALREFFQTEADKHLGRWRDPAQPEFVVYPRGGVPVDTVYVVDEVTGAGYTATRASAARGGNGSASHYFDAHPEPKPWQDAKPEEAWVLSIRGEQVPAVVSLSEIGDFIFTASTNDGGGTEEFVLTDSGITAGRRIWPEEGPS